MSNFFHELASGKSKAEALRDAHSLGGHMP
jgi:hypothetical protein